MLCFLFLTIPFVFVAAAIIVSSVVLQAVEARVNGGNACLCVLADHINRLFIAVFRHVDTLFVERKLTYMEFSELIKGIGFGSSFWFFFLVLLSCSSSFVLVSSFWFFFCVLLLVLWFVVSPFLSLPFSCFQRFD